MVLKKQQLKYIVHEGKVVLRGVKSYTHVSSKQKKSPPPFFFLFCERIGHI